MYIKHILMLLNISIDKIIIKINVTYLSLMMLNKYNLFLNYHRQYNSHKK